MKIAFLNIYQGKVYRGAETFVYELSKRLSKNHEVDVISEVNYLEIIKAKYDLIIPTNGRLQVFLVRLITWLTGAKMVVSGQSGKGLDDRINLYAFPDAFVPISTQALRHSKGRNPFVKSVYIPNGVDLTKFGAAGKTYNSKLHRPIILTVGALVKSKRIDLIIKAVSRLSEANLLIVGDGEERQSLEKLAGELIPGRFEFLRVKHENMPEIYRSADLFALLPYSSEAFGIVYVEAMASGLPVIASNDEQRREIVEEGGILVDHDSEPEEIAFAMSEALRRNWGNKPRKQAEKFDWDIIAKKYEKLLLEL
ncbi:MAG: glycosyltransferase family 4 protein [Patescibacteria group bacterium]